MKKRYTAPDIVFESFSLSVSIASCAIGTNQGQDSCGYKWDPETFLFTSTINECDTVTEDGSKEYNGICYDNPSLDKSLYSS